VRYSLYPPVTDTENVLTNFLPSAYVRANAPRCANPDCSLITLGTGDPLNGIIVAGKNSPFGDAIYAFDKTNIQPRIGLSWDPIADGKTVYRSSYGVYFDQALVGIFEQNAFTNPPFVNTVSILNARLSIKRGHDRDDRPRGQPDWQRRRNFKTPRTQQWNVGMQQQIYARGAIDVSYVGAPASPIRPIDINYRSRPTCFGSEASACASIWLRFDRSETTARSNYWGLLTSFRHDAGAAGS
jgi:hypothetical protein